MLLVSVSVSKLWPANYMYIDKNYKVINYVIKPLLTKYTGHPGTNCCFHCNNFQLNAHLTSLRVPHTGGIHYMISSVALKGCWPSHYIYFYGSPKSLPLNIRGMLSLHQQEPWQQYTWIDMISSWVWIMKNNSLIIGPSGVRAPAQRSGH